MVYTTIDNKKENEEIFKKLLHSMLNTDIKVENMYLDIEEKMIEYGIKMNHAWMFDSTYSMYLVFSDDLYWDIGIYNNVTKQFEKEYFDKNIIVESLLNCGESIFLTENICVKCAAGYTLMKMIEAIEYTLREYGQD